MGRGGGAMDLMGGWGGVCVFVIWHIQSLCRVTSDGQRKRIHVWLLLLVCVCVCVC